MQNFEFQKGEGILKVQERKDGIKINYVCIDDYAAKELSTDDLMKILGYEIKVKVCKTTGSKCSECIPVCSSWKVE